MAASEVPLRGEHVSLTIEDGLATVTLRRPDKLNALTLGMLHSLVDASTKLRKDTSVRGVLLTGEGEAFSAGLDISVAFERPREIAKAFVPNPIRGTNLFQEAAWGWRRVPAPVVAAVHGHCYGGGLQIALAADLRYTTEDTKWAALEAAWGLIPDMTGIQTMSEQLYLDTAKRLILTGEIINGDEAVRIGLATEIAEDPALVGRMMLKHMAVRSPDAVAYGKRLVSKARGAHSRSTLARERRAQARILFSTNFKRARIAAAKGEQPTFIDRRR